MAETVRRRKRVLFDAIFIGILRYSVTGYCDERAKTKTPDFSTSGWVRWITLATSRSEVRSARSNLLVITTVKNNEIEPTHPDHERRRTFAHSNAAYMVGYRSVFEYVDQPMEKPANAFAGKAIDPLQRRWANL